MKTARIFQWKPCFCFLKLCGWKMQGPIQEREASEKTDQLQNPSKSFKEGLYERDSVEQTDQHQNPSKSFKEVLCGTDPTEKIGQINSTNTPSLLSTEQTHTISLMEKTINYWADSLIVRATGKILDPIYFKKWLLGLWRTTTEPEIHHLGPNFFIVHNLNPNDRVKIVTSN